jgi:site-specific recombinase XerD
MTVLRQRMIDAMTLRGFSPKTQLAYIAAVKGLAGHYDCSPDQLSIDQLQAYLLHCLRVRQLSHSSCLQILHGLRFFYLKTLGLPSADLDIPRPKQPQVLPEILSKGELERLFGAVRNGKHQALLKTTYAAGLRVSEVVRLRVRDLDSERMTIRIEQAKGAKDRYTLLAPALLDVLRDYYRVYRPAVWLFPRSHDPAQPLSISSAQRLYTRAKRQAGIAKRGGIHALRHAFATHQLEAGMPMHRLQRLMGHHAISSTLRYIHLVEQPSYLIEGAADLLAAQRGAAEGQP